MELDSGADSVSSTPRAGYQKLGQGMGEDKSVVRLMCSFGGKILPRPHDNQLRYVGGDTRIVAIHRGTNFATLVSKLSKLLLNQNNGENSNSFTVKYQLPNEDLDALITVSMDEDVDNMMEEFERLTMQLNSNSNNSSNNGSKVPRLRLFLFPASTGMEDDNTSRASSINSLLDGSRKRENWFLDALNGGAAGAPLLERGRSEVSSIVSEVPDYLFGLDNSDDLPTRLRSRSRVGLGDGVPGSDPGSPAFGSISSAPSMPNLPPVKTKLENPNPIEDTGEQVVHQGGVYSAGGGGGSGWGHNSNPGSPYPGHGHPMQTIPVYYVPAGPGQGLVPHRNAHMQPVPVSVPITGPFVQQYGPGQVQVPMGYPGTGPFYGGGAVRADPYEMQVQGNMVQGQSSSGMNHPLYYGVKNGGGMVASYPGMVVTMAGDEAPGLGSGSDPPKGRTLQP